MELRCSPSVLSGLSADAGLYFRTGCPARVCVAAASFWAQARLECHDRGARQTGDVGEPTGRDLSATSSLSFTPERAHALQNSQRGSDTR